MRLLQEETIKGTLLRISSTSTQSHESQSPNRKQISHTIRGHQCRNGKQNSSKIIEDYHRLLKEQNILQSYGMRRSETGVKQKYVICYTKAKIFTDTDFACFFSPQTRLRNLWFTRV